jgi:hypothetical protein
MDQRSSKRHRTFLDGRIIFNNRCSVINCTVRDVSDTGARVAFGHIILIPTEFELEIPKKGLFVWARVMWSNGKEHGVKFTTGPQAAVINEASKVLDESRSHGSNVPEPSAPDGAIIQKILDEAQHQIARAMRAPADTVQLKLEIDLGQAGVRKH